MILEIVLLTAAGLNALAGVVLLAYRIGESRARKDPASYQRGYDTGYRDASALYTGPRRA